jgi:hypothetical protein
MASLNQIEKKVLKKIAENHLMTKIELKNFLKGSTSSDKETTSLVETVTRSLIDKKLLAAINPVGSTCYLITQNGTRFLDDMD